MVCSKPGTAHAGVALSLMSSWILPTTPRPTSCSPLLRDSLIRNGRGRCDGGNCVAGTHCVGCGRRPVRARPIGSLAVWRVRLLSVGPSGGLEPCRCSRPARDAAPTIAPTIFWSDRLAADAGPGRPRPFGGREGGRQEDLQQFGVHCQRSQLTSTDPKPDTGRQERRAVSGNEESPPKSDKQFTRWTLPPESVLGRALGGLAPCLDRLCRKTFATSKGKLFH